MFQYFIIIYVIILIWLCFLPKYPLLFKEFFNADEKEVADYLSHFDDELKNLYYMKPLDIQKGAENGSIEAMMMYAEMLFFGRGVKTDFERQGGTTAVQCFDVGCRLL